MPIPFFPDHWYYNTESGQLTKGNNLENLGNNLVGGAGWHELNIPGSASEAQAAAEAQREFPNGKPPTTTGITPGRIVSNAAQEAGATTGWTHNVEQWVIRGFEMLLGIGLIIVALAKLAADTPAGRAAAKAGKVAAIL